MIHININKFIKKHTINQLINTPPKYINHNNNKQLTKKIKHKPYSIILFNKIKKTHPNIFNILLQILNNKHLTNTKKHTINFKNTIIIITSNIKTQKLQDQQFTKFNNSNNKQNYKTIQKTILKKLKNSFHPKFLNHINNIIIFHKLTKKKLKKIITIIINKLTNQLSKQNINIIITNKTKNKITKKKYDPKYNTKPLIKTIQKTIKNNLNKLILNNNQIKNKKITIDHNNKKFKYNITKQTSKTKTPSQT